MAAPQQALMTGQQSGGTPIPPSTQLWNPTGSLGRAPQANEELFDIDLRFSASLPAGLLGSGGGCEVAPTNSVTFPLYQNGVSIGSMNIAAGATTATFTFAAGVNFVIGDRFKMNAPNPADPTLSGPFYAFLGSR